MKVTFTRSAMITLKAHYEYHCQKGGVKSAQKFRKRIFDRAKLLETFPRIGKSEEKYEHQDAEIRFLVEGHYKIVYEVTESQVFIHHIVDSRSDPSTSSF